MAVIPNHFFKLKIEVIYIHGTKLSSPADKANFLTSQTAHTLRLIRFPRSTGIVNQMNSIIVLLVIVCSLDGSFNLALFWQSIVFTLLAVIACEHAALIFHFSKLLKMYPLISSNDDSSVFCNLHFGLELLGEEKQCLFLCSQISKGHNILQSINQ